MTAPEKTFTFTPIGHVRSPFTEQAGTPIQSAVARDAVGQIVLSEEYVPALKDVEGFERLWVIFVLDRAAPPRLQVTPYRDTVERGVFATRAPSRPNPIGLSVVRLERIEGNVLHIRGLDMLDGTPVLDLKPYVSEFDSYADSKAGWLDARRAAAGHADARFAKPSR